MNQDPLQFVWGMCLLTKCMFSKTPAPFLFVFILVITDMPNKQAEWMQLGLCQLMAKSKAGESNWWKYIYKKDIMRRNHFNGKKYDHYNIAYKLFILEK